jgi:hypothetical protein
MKKVSLKGFGHTSFAIISAIVGLSWGVILGAVVFFGSFMSDSIAAMIPKDIVQGVPSPIVMLFLVPAFFGVAGFLLGFVSYPIFSSLLRLTDGLNIESDMSYDDLDGAKTLSPARRR